MRFPSLRGGTTVVTRALSCVAAAAFVLALAGPAGAAEPQGSIEPAPQGAKGQAPQQAPSGPEAVALKGSINPRGDTDGFRIKLEGGSGRVFTFALYNGTAGFDPAMVIRGGGKTFLVNKYGPSSGEVFRLLVRGTVTVTVTVGGWHGNSVGNYLLKVTP